MILCTLYFRERKRSSSVTVIVIILSLSKATDHVSTVSRGLLLLISYYISVHSMYLYQIAENADQVELTAYDHSPYSRRKRQNHLQQSEYIYTLDLYKRTVYFNTTLTMNMIFIVLSFS